MKHIFLILSFCFFSSLILTAQDKATPRKGEGIIAFLERNNRDFNRDYHSFIELNKGKFGANNSLRLDKEYVLPPIDGKPAGKQEKTPTGKKRKEPLFGKAYEEYTVNSSRLKDATYYLVAGHGGPDCGAIAKVEGKDLHEDEYNYDIVLRLARNLLQEGATVHIIIQDKKDGIRDGKHLKNSNTETCMGKLIPLNQRERLKQRSDKINELSRQSKSKYQRAIFIHIDSRETGHEQIDMYFLHHPNSKKGKRLANNIRQTIRQQYEEKRKGRGYKGKVDSRDLYVLNNTDIPCVFAELGNMQNKQDQKRYVDPSNRQAIANWILKGLIEDYKEEGK